MRQRLGFINGSRLRSGLFMAVILLTAGLAPIALACNPDCGPCMHWEGPVNTGSCVLNSGAECAEDSDCPGDCQRCSNCQCVSDPALCTGECDTCLDGTCTSLCVDPVAAIQPVEDTTLGSLMLFDGSGSYDPDGTTLTYSWNLGNACVISDDGSVAVGRFISIGDQRVSLSITDNDNPECSSECDDHIDDTSKSVNVSLPSGCSECSGPRQFSLNVDDDYYDPMQICAGECGRTDFTANATVDLQTPCYRNGIWEVPVSANQVVPWGPCDGFVDVTENPEVVNSENYCSIVTAFNTSTGCVRPTDTLYSVKDCVIIHEEYHVEAYRQRVDDAAAELKNSHGMIDIDCKIPDTFECHSALNKYRESIENAIKDVYQNCVLCQEEQAQDVARECFNAVAMDICDTALQFAWPPCSQCENSD